MISYTLGTKLTLQVVKTYFLAMECHPLDKPLKQMRDPVPDEEIETYTKSKRMNVMCHGDADVDTTTVKDVKNVSKDTGTDESMIVCADQTPATSGTNPKDGEIISIIFVLRCMLKDSNVRY